MDNGLFNIALESYNSGDYKTAYEIWKDLADKGDASAQFKMGYLYRNGRGIEINKAKAIEWYRKSACQGYVDDNLNAASYLAVILYENKQYEEYEFWMLKAAENGGILDLYAVARMYHNFTRMYYNDKEKVEINIQKAMYYYEKAADQNLTSAYYHLGNLYKEEPGFKDLKKSLFWFLKAAKEGHQTSQCIVGEMFAKEKNYIDSVFWLSKSAEQENMIAQVLLADKYMNGEGVEKDMTKAIELYRKSAKQGYSVAENMLGMLYYNGEGVERDIHKSYEWFLKAARYGDAEAQYNKGVLLYNGEATNVLFNYRECWQYNRGVLY